MLKKILLITLITGNGFANGMNTIEELNKFVDYNVEDQSKNSNTIQTFIDNNKGSFDCYIATIKIDQIFVFNGEKPTISIPIKNSLIKKASNNQEIITFINNLEKVSFGVANPNSDIKKIINQVYHQNNNNYDSVIEEVD